MDKGLLGVADLEVIDSQDVAEAIHFREEQLMIDGSNFFGECTDEGLPLPVTEPSSMAVREGGIGLGNFFDSFLERLGHHRVTLPYTLHEEVEDLFEGLGVPVQPNTDRYQIKELD